MERATCVLCKRAKPIGNLVIRTKVVKQPDYVRHMHKTSESSAAIEYFSWHLQRTCRRQRDGPKSCERILMSTCNELLHCITSASASRLNSEILHVNCCIHFERHIKAISQRRGFPHWRNFSVRKALSCGKHLNS